ncbi:MAG: TPM domain-containing protein [Bacteroidota bacterium]
MKNLVKKLFTKEDLSAIAAAISEAEKLTAGEIRVSIRQKRRWRERKLSIEEMARREFHDLGMTKTKDHTGILIFLLMDERKFFILADEGIHNKVEEATWTKIAEEISSHFSKKNFHQGVIHGVQAVGRVLSRFFPRKATDTNELPNDVHVQ